jgi:hypothetical protein
MAKKQENNTSKKFTIIAGVLFVLSMGFFIWTTNFAQPFSWRGFSLQLSEDLRIKKKKEINNITRVRKLTPDTVLNKQKDTSHHRILLVGDSQVEGLRIPFYDYCIKNKHELVAAMTWYSSTDLDYAANDTLSQVIKKYKPDYIVMVIGLNELWMKNQEPSTAAVRKIIDLFDTIPYAWIGPANWQEDHGINETYQKTVDPGCFFLSKDLVLPRAKDGRHPSRIGYQIWMDSLAYWFEEKAFFRLPMKKPDSVNRNRKINNILLTKR